MSWIDVTVLVVIGALPVALVAALKWSRRRNAKARRVANALPVSVRSEVLASIDRAGLEGGTRSLLLLVFEGAGNDPYSKIHGLPFLPPGFALPQAATKDGCECPRSA